MNYGPLEEQHVPLITELSNSKVDIFKEGEQRISTLSINYCTVF